MMTEIPVVGQTLKFAAVFVDESGSSANTAATTKLILRPPSGASVAVSPQQVGTGQFYGKYTPATPGKWKARWEGNVSGNYYAEEKWFTVAPREVPAAP